MPTSFTYYSCTCKKAGTAGGKNKKIHFSSLYIRIYVYIVESCVYIKARIWRIFNYISLSFSCCIVIYGCLDEISVKMLGNIAKYVK